MIHEEVMDQSQNGHDQNAVTPGQAKIPIYSDEDLKKVKDDQKRLDEELKSTYGEITLITCPIETCLIHHPLNSNNTSNDNAKTNSDANLVINDKVKPKQLKRACQEDFKLPKKDARTIKERHIEQVICTSSNKFAVLEVEDDQTSGRKSSDPPPAKPILLRIVKDYNLIVQDVNRKFPATVNKMAGDYIKIQPATPDDPRDITALLEEIKAEHYIIKPLSDRPIKVVIKGLPVSTDVADIEADLVQKGFALEKVAQWRKFSTKDP
ncbi:nucleic-acid-binding protein from transposon X-element [Trichonephila clavipes]|nr:nucleic-acid-binding protein from transposon X-element [Trichonephila clavipes]